MTLHIFNMAGIRGFPSFQQLYSHLKTGSKETPPKIKSRTETQEKIEIRSVVIGLISLAFAAAIGITFLVLGCALPQFNNWWPLFVLFFYILAPLPMTLSKRCMNSFDSSSSACLEMAIFVTTGIVVSSMGLPVVLAHVSIIQWGACALVLSANIVVFLTILGYFIVFDSDDLDYSMW